MEIKVLAFAICYSCVSYTLLLTPVVGGQNINSAEKTTVRLKFNLTGQVGGRMGKVQVNPARSLSSR